MYMLALMFSRGSTFYLSIFNMKRNKLKGGIATYGLLPFSAARNPANVSALKRFISVSLNLKRRTHRLILQDFLLNCTFFTVDC